MSKKYPPQQLHIDTSSEEKVHIPVLLEATVAALSPEAGESYLDLTAGYGGHACAIIAKTDAPDKATLVDRDENAIRHIRAALHEDVTLRHEDFATAAEQLAQAGETFDMILIDLGVSSPQLDIATRGFSFRSEAPLDMRMDNRQEATAATLVNTATEDTLMSLLIEYGEESRSQARSIAQAIIAARPLNTTLDLAQTVAAAYRSRRQKTHPATRTFQAIRIAVNEELAQIERTLPLLPRLLSPGGRVAIISFHSLEDRLVKRFFKQQAQAGYEAELLPLTKKPVSGATEDVHNPRARSAKLRAAVKIKT